MRKLFSAFLHSLYSVLKRLRRPRAIILLFVYFSTLLSGALAIWLAVSASDSILIQILSYMSYALAALLLGYSVYTVVIYAKEIKRGTVALIRSLPFGARLLDQYGFRTMIFSSLSVLVGLLNIGLNISLAFYSRAFWYGSLATYYLLLMALRAYIIGSHARGRDRLELFALKQYRTTGLFLSIIPFTLAIPIIQIIFIDRAFRHSDWTVYAFAAYAFFKVIKSIVGFIRRRHAGDHSLMALESIGLSDALVSIFALQTSLLYTFSEDSTARSAANAATGIAVCILTAAIGILMVSYSNKKMKEMK